MSNHTHENPKVDLAYRRKKNAEEMKKHLISFALMIFLTLIAFYIVAFGEFTHWFIKPFILLLAVIQVFFQMFYFMHLSQKGHGVPQIFTYSSLIGVILFTWAFMTVVWW